MLGLNISPGSSPDRNSFQGHVLVMNGCGDKACTGYLLRFHELGSFGKTEPPTGKHLQSSWPIGKSVGRFLD